MVLCKTMQSSKQGFDWNAPFILGTHPEASASNVPSLSISLVAVVACHGHIGWVPVMSTPRIVSELLNGFYPNLLRGRRMTRMKEIPLHSGAKIDAEKKAGILWGYEYSLSMGRSSKHGRAKLIGLVTNILTRLF